MSQAATETRPTIGTIVNYRCTHHRDEKTRPAVVVGYCDKLGAGAVHLAVLTDDADNLDLLSLSVPHDPAAVTIGSWHHQHWPSAEGNVDAE